MKMLTEKGMYRRWAPKEQIIRMIQMLQMIQNLYRSVPSATHTADVWKLIFINLDVNNFLVTSGVREHECSRSRGPSDIMRVYALWVLRSSSISIWSFGCLSSASCSSSGSREGTTYRYSGFSILIGSQGFHDSMYIQVSEVSHLKFEKMELQISQVSAFLEG